VAERADTPLGDAAVNAIAKIAAVLPEDLRDRLETSNLLIGPGEPIAAGDVELASIRTAIRSEQKLLISYADGKGKSTKRTIWPFALAFFDRARVVIAWCELRKDYRHFRTDRIAVLEPTHKRYPRRRQALLKEWRTLEGIPEQ
jgi:predicted DNA-binding transcriptional regulator YafY